LYGMGLLLVGQYFRSHCQDDSRAIRATVATLGVLASIQFVFLTHQIYFDYIRLFGDTSDLDWIVFSAPAQLLAIFLTAFVAQIFFASRIWILTRHSICYTTPIIMLAFLQIGAGITQTILVFQVKRYSLLDSTVRVSSTQSGATAACDIVITAVLCYILHGARSGIKRTDSIINQMIAFAINRGAATSLCALLNLIFFVGKPHTFIFMIFLEPSCQLYLISVISMLTNRQHLRAQLDHQASYPHSNSLHLGRISLSCNTHPVNPASITSPDEGVFVQKHIVTWRDNA